MIDKNPPVICFIRHVQNHNLLYSEFTQNKIEKQSPARVLCIYNMNNYSVGVIKQYVSGYLLVISGAK